MRAILIVGLLALSGCGTLNAVFRPDLPVETKVLATCKDWAIALTSAQSPQIFPRLSDDAVDIVSTFEPRIERQCLKAAATVRAVQEDRPHSPFDFAGALIEISDALLELEQILIQAGGDV